MELFDKSKKTFIPSTSESFGNKHKDLLKELEQKEETKKELEKTSLNRRKLTTKEKALRKSRNKMAKASRKANRV